MRHTCLKRSLIATLLLLNAGGARAAWNVTEQPAAQRIGPGVTPPRLIYKVEPEYTPEARDANVQATVAFEIVVSEKGKATNISVLSPAGFGLDERAEAAIRQWVFLPGQKDGKPVPILATVEANFRFQNVPFDRKAEDRRTRFNVALARLSSGDGKLAATAADTIGQLAKEKFAPAIYQMGLLYGSGRIVPRDPDRSAALLADAARRKYGPAMYDLGMQLLTAAPASRNPEQGLEMLRGAAERGSRAAQFELGARHEKGNGVRLDRTRSMHYFRLCAATGASVCQYRLATLLRAQPEGDQRKTIEAIAWLELAAGQGYTEAKKLLAVELHKLTAEQIGQLDGLKKLLVHK
jgi:TonB family protein